MSMPAAPAIRPAAPAAQPIAFNAPVLSGAELANIAELLAGHGPFAGPGAYIAACEEWLQDAMDAAHVLLTQSCTSALELAALLCDIGSGDEVIMPSYTFASTANAFVLRGAVPVFVDIRRDTLNLDETLIAPAITQRTRAIVVVHYGGYPCEMDAIAALARGHGLRLIEDAAHALLGQSAGRWLGTIGDLGCLSFHESKKIMSGEGGALIVNHPSLRERAELMWEKGTNRRAFQRGEVDRYTWIDAGLSGGPSQITAAFLLAQLRVAPRMVAQFRAGHALYRHLLAPLADTIGLPPPAKSDGGNANIFPLLTRSASECAALMAWLDHAGIQALTHYVPLHSSPAGQRFGRLGAARLPVTDFAGQAMLRLPLHAGLTEADIRRVAASVVAFYGSPTAAPSCVERT
jgi:dTDP-4-amino-4,6-dideoxygalactose transaminase